MLCSLNKRQRQVGVVQAIGARLATRSRRSSAQLWRRPVGTRRPVWRRPSSSAGCRQTVPGCAGRNYCHDPAGQQCVVVPIPISLCPAARWRCSSGVGEIGIAPVTEKRNRAANAYLCTAERSKYGTTLTSALWRYGVLRRINIGCYDPSHGSHQSTPGSPRMTTARDRGSHRGQVQQAPGPRL